MSQDYQKQKMLKEKSKQKNAWSSKKGHYTRKGLSQKDLLAMAAF